MCGGRGRERGRERETDSTGENVLPGVSGPIRSGLIFTCSFNLKYILRAKILIASQEVRTSTYQFWEGTNFYL